MRRLAILLAIITITTSLLAVPSKMFFQGKFTDDMGNPIDGVETVITSIWDSGPAGSGGLLWCDTNVVVFNTGLFVELLGDDKPIPDSCFQDGFVKFLEIQVGDALLEPRKPLVTVPYAFHAALADSVVGGSVNYDSIIAYIDTFINDTLGAYLDTTWRFDLDTLGAYLDTTFAGSISHIDSISYIDSISFIDSVLWIYHITHVDSISFIDSVSYIRYISFIDSITHVDSVSYIAHISYIDSIAHIDSIHWIDSIGYIDFISYIDSVGYIDSIGWVGHTIWADSAHWAGYVHWDSIDGIPDSVLAGEDHDWQVSGDDLYSIPTGNVGIGVVSPSSKLDVDGVIEVNRHIKVGSDASYLGLYGSNTIHNGAYIDLFSADYPTDYGGKVRIRYGNFLDIAPTTACVDIRMSSDSTEYPVMMMDYDQNVGIGTTTPTQKLDVNGNVKVGDTLFIGDVANDPAPDSVLTIVDGQVMKAAYGSGTDADWQISGDDMFSIPTGNVGIGTMTPEAGLDVASNTRLTGNVAVGGTLPNPYNMVYVGDNIESSDSIGHGIESIMTGIDKDSLCAIRGSVYYSDLSTTDSPSGLYIGVFSTASNLSDSKSVESLQAIRSTVSVTGSGGGDVAEEAAGCWIDYHFSGTNKVKNLYGLSVAEVTSYGSENNYGIWVDDAYGAIGDNYSIYSVGDNYFGGDVGIGVNPPTAKLDVNGNVNVNGEINFNQNEAKNMALENRTSDPPTPVVGQMWIRTDL